MLSKKKDKQFKFSSILGEHIILNKGELLTTDHHLENKIVGLYFSSSWCPPCQRFTPELIQFYNRHHQDSNFEIVLIPYHEDNLTQYKKYFSKMPWASHLIKDNFDIENLRKRYKCISVPTLIFINSQGAIIHKIIGHQQRNEIINYPTSMSFIKKVVLTKNKTMKKNLKDN